jgi:glyoxylase-like metal-dependent hydrolase (beta-lactamase superfamily II)
MKFKRVLLAAVLIIIASIGIAQAEGLTQIAENVYSYVDREGSKENSFGANAGIIVGEKGIVVVDTLMSAKEAKQFIEDIRAVSDKPIKYVINTHYHLDHAMGNCEFAELGAVIIGQDNDKAAMEKTAAETLKNVEVYGLTEADMEGTVPAYPELSFKERMEIDLGDQKVQLIHARYSHTEGDTLVYLPDKKVLFTGDVLFTDFHPFLGEGNIDEWTAQLEEIKAMDVEKIIPGHGPLSDKEDLAEMQEYLLIFDREAKRLTESSEDVQAVTEEMLKVLPAREGGSWLVSPNIQMKYLPSSDGN